MIDPTRQPTFTGKAVDPFDMKVDDVCVEDIAHHLSLINRYNGATPYPYSVAQHVILVTDILFLAGAPLRTQSAGLHHDDSETWLGDLTTPIKHNPMSEAYRGAEWRVMRLIEAVFELPYGSTDSDIVKWADQEALEREWWTLIEPDGRKTPPSLEKWSPEKAEELYLHRVAELDRMLGVEV